MATNKVNSHTPTMSLGPPSQATSELPPMTITQSSLVTNPMGAQGLGLSTNTLNAFNAFSSSHPTLSTLSAPRPSLCAMNPGPQSLNTMNAPTQTRSPLNAPGTLNTLGSATFGGNSPNQTFLPSTQLANIVSLPQSLCFPSQSSQSAMSMHGSSPATMGVTLGFPVATGTSLTSNTLSLGTNSILNSSGLSFNTGTLFSGSSILQPLSMAQSQAICTSLPQSISFLGIPNNVTGSAGSHFLASSFSGFPGLSSVFVNGQQSLLLGSPGSGAPQNRHHSALTRLAPQSLTFPVSGGPVLTELSSTPQPSDPSFVSKPEARPFHPVQAEQCPSVASPATTSSQKDAETILIAREEAGQERAVSVDPPPASEQVPEPKAADDRGGTDETEIPESALSTQSTNHLETDQILLSVSEASSSEEEVSEQVQSDTEVGPVEASKESGPDTSGKEDMKDKLDQLNKTGEGSIPDVNEIKQEAVETEESTVSSPEPQKADVETPPLSFSPIKIESSEDQVDSGDKGTMERTVLGSFDKRSSPSLLTTFKKEHLACLQLKENGEDEDSEAMPLADSSEDSLDSRGTSPHLFPMASLRLTHADTTVATPAFGLARLYEENASIDFRHHAAETLDDAELEFVWEDYLSFTNTVAVPPTAFKHVECSLQSSFEKGMRVEVAKKENPGTYWVAAIIMNSGPLLRLRWEGMSESDSSAVFWSEFGCDVHPIGWCAEHGKKLEPPEGIKDNHEDWEKVLQELLKTVPHAPGYLLDSTTGTSPFEQLKQGMLLEMQHTSRPNEVWLVRIMENVGGRLYLHVEGAEAGGGEFWEFYLSYLLHPIGWAADRGYSYKAPKILTDQGLSESDTKKILDAALDQAMEQTLPSAIFKDQLEISKHRFRQGVKLEAVNPNNGSQIGPATVVEVIDDFYFVVEMDDLTSDSEKGIRFSCHCKSPFIFPIQWTVYKGIKLTSPPGWQKPDFNWQDYLIYCKAVAAPESCFDLDQEEHEFERGMKLECVNPDNPNQICVATITKIVAHLMWVHLDSSSHLVASHVEYAGSHNLFPVGWCESNGYPLQPPFRVGHRVGHGIPRRVAVVQPEQSEGRMEDGGRTYNGNLPIVYFNHKCFSGPLLSKSRLSEVPRSIGPGPVHLVMKEVLSLLISVAYKPSKVLRELQQEGAPNPTMTPQILKAKYQGKSYKAVVEVCRSVVQLENFCRGVCIKLECCPYLISPHFISNACPEGCWRLTKTKYTHYYGKKKRKIGRPPGGHSNLEEGPKKPPKRRRRKRLGMVVRKTHTTFGVEGSALTVDGSDSAIVDSSSGVTFHPHRTDIRPHPHGTPSATAAASKRLKRKYTHHIPPPSEIRTRGAKLPRYSFERRTHKKILLSPIISGVQGLRSKSAQVHKSHVYTRSASPEPVSRPQSLGNLYSANSRASSSPSPSTPMSSVSNGPSFSLPPPTSPLPLDRNPLTWSVEDTVNFIKTTDCAHVSKLFREQEIDGQALLLLTLPAVQEHLNLKLGPALKLCHEIERVKCAFYTRYDPSKAQPRH